MSLIHFRHTDPCVCLCLACWHAWLAHTNTHTHILYRIFDRRKHFKTSHSLIAMIASVLTLGRLQTLARSHSVTACKFKMTSDLLRGFISSCLTVTRGKGAGPPSIWLRLPSQQTAPIKRGQPVWRREHELESLSAGRRVWQPTFDPLMSFSQGGRRRRATASGFTFSLDM